MTAALCAALAVVAAGAALRPRPRPRQRDMLHVSTTGRTPLIRRLVRALPRRHSEITPFDVATWCEGVSRALRSGSTLTTAIRVTPATAALAPDIDRIVLALDRGVAVADAVAVPISSSHLDVATIVLRACAANGGSAAEPLDRAAATLRARAADTADRRVQSAQARLSAVVMTVLPLAMLCLLLATSSATRGAVVTTPGLAAVATGAVLNLTGWRWMRRLILGAGS